MEKELAPMRLKFELRLNKMVSIAVRIPTKQAIPTEMINKVSIDLNKFERMALRATRMFSRKFTD